MSGYAAMRTAAGLSQEEAAEKIGVERSTVSKWETGAALPRSGLIPKILDVYNCRFEDLQNCEQYENQK